MRIPTEPIYFDDGMKGALSLKMGEADEFRR
jgi:hypothetical protein